jgi:aminopeptidase C
MLKELFINLFETIKQQSMLILQIIKTGKDSEKLHELKDSLIRNMIRISSVSMDVHIVYTLNHDFSRKRKDVHIFVGMCHAIRLAKYFNFDARIDTEYDLNRCMKVD